MNATPPPPPSARHRCEARVPGKATHEFATPDEECARATCDAAGWEFIRCYAVGSDADRPANAPSKGDPPLSRSQVRALAIEAGKAHAIMLRLDLTDDTEDAWRHEQIMGQVGRAGLTECQNSHFRKLLNHFRRLQGDKAGKPGGPQSGEGGDTLERREQILMLLARELGSHAQRVGSPATDADRRASEQAAARGGIIGEGYLLQIARAKNPGTTLTDIGCLIKLTAARLDQLHSTLRNRIAAREGRGTPETRNKSQRKKPPGK